MHSEKINALIARERALIDSIGFERLEGAQALEKSYMNAILSLDPTDKAIAINTYINGIPYWKTGIELGYSEEGVRKRIAKIIKKIAMAL